MNFGQAVRSCFSNYATFSGRASRSEYWYWVLFVFIGGIVTLIIDAFIIGDLELAPVNLIFSLVTTLPGLTVSVRRLHDINRSGWWALIAFTVIGLFVLLYWAIQPSKDEGNRYS